MSHSRASRASGVVGALAGMLSITGATTLAGATTTVPRALKSNTRQIGFGERRAGTYFGDEAATIVNTGTQPVTIKQIAFHGGDTSDFVVGTNCFPHGRPATLTPKTK